MKTRNIYKWILSVYMLTALICRTSFADGIIVPPPGVNMCVKYHRVEVEIQNQIAYTEIDQVFINDSDIDSLEAVYIFPLPEGATFDSFSMWVDGEELSAETLDADSARNFYYSIVQRNLDPALLEYLGTGLFRARIFPIRAHGEKRIKISYHELLPYDNEIIRYLYPLSTEKHSSKPLEDVSIIVNLSSPDPIKTIYSPSHNITIEKTDDYTAKIIYSDENITPANDFILYYTVSSDDIGMHLLSHRPSGEDGYYLFMAAPKKVLDSTEVIPKRVIFVLDRSGSMSGEKILQAKDALRFCVNNLNNVDWFNLVDFASEIKTFRKECIAADLSNLSTALNYIDGIQATGGTDINNALLTALTMTKNDSLTNMIIFLTDGQPTVGVTDTDQINNNVEGANNNESRLFVFGVGYDVNTHLLDKLSNGNHGTSTYVRPDENIEVAVSSFFAKVSNPVLSSLSLDYGSISIYDYYPEELPDLFHGSQIIQFGRYQGNGTSTITLSGNAGGSVQNFSIEAAFHQENLENEFIPRLWALRKVGKLLDLIRINGESEELVQEVTVIAKRWGIITPYTAFLIHGDEVTPGSFDDLSQTTGRGAFDVALDIGNYTKAENIEDVQSFQVRYAGDKTFFLRDSIWVDAEFAENQPRTIFDWGSKAYFEFLTLYPEAGKYFALGKYIVISIDGNAYSTTSYSSVTPQPGIPANYNLYQNFPNPFNPETTIKYKITKITHITLKIYDLLGQEIRILIDRQKEPGIHEVNWDGKDNRGCPVPTGIYFYIIETDDYVQSKKMIFIK